MLTLFRNRVFADVIKLVRLVGWALNSMTVVLIRRDTETQRGECVETWGEKAE